MIYDKGFVGLANKNGDNHCFLNVIVQSFWHLASFRRNFMNCVQNHRHPDNELQVRVLCEEVEE